MLKYGNKEFRNLQEQVAKNMADIQDIMQGTTVLADFGIKVVGQVEDATELPDPAEYEGEYGDAYIVGESEPYDYYIFTRAFEGQEEPSWFDLGQFPVPGPQGETGATGATGATPVITNVVSTTTLSAGQDATVSVVKSGTDAAPTFSWSFGVPQGSQGIQGETGATGAQGPQGPAGPSTSVTVNGTTYTPTSGVVTLPGIVELSGDQTIAGDKKFTGTIQTNLISGYRETGLTSNYLSIASGEDEVAGMTIGSSNSTGGSFEMHAMDANGDNDYGSISINNTGIALSAYDSAGDAVGNIKLSNTGVLIEADADETNNGELKLNGAFGTNMSFDTNGALTIEANSITVDSDYSGNDYLLKLTALPNSDPNVSNAVWSDNGNLVLSGYTAPSGGSSIIKTFPDGLTSGYTPSSYTNSGIITDTNKNLFKYTSTVKNSLFVAKGTSYGDQYFGNFNEINGAVIIGNGAGEADSSWKASLKNTLWINGNRYTYTVPGGSYESSLIIGTLACVNSSGAFNTPSVKPNNSINYCEILGDSNSLHPTNAAAYYKFLMGRGLYWYGGNHGTDDYQKSHTICGQFNADTTNGSHFIVGAGTSATARANCFETGVDSNSQKFIIIGTTKLTEAQLQALLATI